jgi:tRNA nucleotidyltransferase (CCA-adding enzyme)
MLARRAVEMEIVGKLTNARVRDELIDIFSEPPPLPLAAVERLEDLGALRTLHPGLAVTGAMRGRYRRLEERLPGAIALLGGEVRKWVPSLAAMLEELPPREAEKWCHLMRFKRGDSEAILQCLRRVPDTLRSLGARGTTPSRVVDFLDPLDGEALAYLYVLAGPALREKVVSYVRSWKDMQTEIDGNDLAEMGLRPSRAYGEILAAVRAAKLDGKVKGRAEELALARRLVAENEKG